MGPGRDPGVPRTCLQGLLPLAAQPLPLQKPRAFSSGKNSVQLLPTVFMFSRLGHDGPPMTDLAQGQQLFGQPCLSTSFFFF
jgi:hypothetical protein